MFNKTSQPRKKFIRRSTVRYQIPTEGEIDYKNFSILQRFLNERGKIVSRRVTGISSKGQRQLTAAIKNARFLALLTSGAAKR